MAAVAGRRILTSPLHLAGGLGLDQLGSLVAIDVTLRWWRANGQPGEAVAAPFAGSLAGHNAVDRELAREGHDRGTLGREGFIERAHAVEQSWREEAAALLRGLRVDLGMELDTVSTDAPEVVDAARVAFVRLFDAGLLELAERVVNVCPRCTTVVHAADAEAGTVGSEVLTISVQWSDDGEPVLLEIRHPELLPGAVAVAVPAGHPAEGHEVMLPVLGRSVPVVAGAAGDTAELVVPAHDARSHEIAYREGLAPVEILGADGTVSASGSLEGLPRFGARAEAIAMLKSEAEVVAHLEMDDPVGVCRGCATVLVPRLGRHWFLRTEELEVAAADAARGGLLTFVPATSQQDFINWVGYTGDWCLSHQIWGGHTIPVAMCGDCGSPAVGIEVPPACRKCFGELEPETAVFDARFLGVIWSLVTAGWPDGPELEDIARATTLAVRPGGLFTWAVPMAALGLRLAGVPPFATVVVHAASGAEAPDAADPAAARLAALGGLEQAEAAELAARLRKPPEGTGDIQELEALVIEAFESLRAETVIGPLAAATAVGIVATDRVRLGRIIAPLTGVQGGMDGSR